jgi:hypothetical protein
MQDSPNQPNKKHGFVLVCSVTKHILRFPPHPGPTGMVEACFPSEPGWAGKVRLDFDSIFYNIFY